ncbi:hypothetical protein BHM03_00022481 [Ensete ventricosum]|uniref:EIPR1-like beta-propeller domain-containing protein n=1 Tax=Ensete ventricosum TaxID=4639 RepID=A0A445MGH3_ENSVE|nr:hypothetical protein BHM03_00022481 [Ensete ventricosum]
MRGASTGIVYGGLKYQARCIADVKADTDHTSFLAGTLSLKEENEVHLIRLSTPGLELVCEGLFYHPNEIWDLKSCPFNPRIFSTVFTSGEQSILVVTGSGSRYDFSRKTSSIEQAHARDFDYNPKKQHLLVSAVTAEDISGIRLWDLRSPKFPVKELPGHAHWYLSYLVSLLLSYIIDAVMELLILLCSGGKYCLPKSSLLILTGHGSSDTILSTTN